MMVVLPPLHLCSTEPGLPCQHLGIMVFPTTIEPPGVVAIGASAVHRRGLFLATSHPVKAGTVTHHFLPLYHHLALQSTATTTLSWMLYLLVTFCLLPTRYSSVSDPSYASRVYPISKRCWPVLFAMLSQHHHSRSSRFVYMINTCESCVVYGAWEGRWVMIMKTPSPRWT